MIDFPLLPHSSARHGLRAAAWFCAATLLLASPASRAAESTAAGAPGDTQARSVKVGSGQRSYRIHVPAALPRDRAVPLVLVFHGGGGTPEQIERESRFSALAAREGFLVAYPAGHRRSWNDGRGAAAVAAQRDDVDDIAFVAALLDDVSARHRVDPKRVFATGISNGAMFSHYVALRLAPRIAAIAAIAGGLPERLASPFSPQGEVAVLIVNGTEDPLVPYGGGDVTVLGSRRGRVVGAEATAARWSEHNRCDVSPAAEQLAERDPGDGCTATHFIYRNCAPGAGVELYRLTGSGHAWPGGSQYVRERQIGKVCRELDGAALVWEFFQRHPKP